jgi:CheY-like chemotaxis protein
MNTDMIFDFIFDPIYCTDTHDIGLTGNALDSDITYFMSCGANEVMTKPFDLPHFQELMKNIN